MALHKDFPNDQYAILDSNIHGYVKNMYSLCIEYTYRENYQN